jgi:hypothetical protein
MSDPIPTPGHPDHGEDWDPINRAPRDGLYEAMSRRTGNKLGRKRFHEGQKFGGWPGCRDSDVIWSTEPVRPHSHDDTVPAPSVGSPGDRSGS